MEKFDVNDATAVAPSEQSITAGEVYDFAVLKQLCRDVGEELIPELLSGFEDDLQQDAQTIPMLREAEDVVTLTRTAHSLKSSAATFGAHRLSAIALTIETLGRQDLLDALYDALLELLSEMGLAPKHLPKSP